VQTLENTNNSCSFNDWEELKRQDEQAKKDIEKAHITDHQRYNEIVMDSINDFIGIAEAYKSGSIATELELIENIKGFLQEYTVCLLPIIAAPSNNGSGPKE
jgi:protein involved in ribonucleotide reduction